MSKNIMSSQCLVNLKLGLLFVSSRASFITLTLQLSQHSLRVDLKGLLIHTSKSCMLDVHPAGTLTTLMWPIKTMLLLRRPLN